MGTEPRGIPHQGDGLVARAEVEIGQELDDVGGAELSLQPAEFEEQAPQLVAEAGLAEVVGQVLEEVAVVGPARPALGTATPVGLKDLTIQDYKVGACPPDVVVLEVV